MRDKSLLSALSQFMANLWTADRPDSGGDVKRRVPTRVSDALFRARAAALQIRRGVQDRHAGIRRWPEGDAAAFPFVLAESCTPLWGELSGMEREMETGKIQNLRRAARRLHRAEVPAGGIFSFWKQVGRATRRGGYTEGRLLREGCLVPSVGGGLCQLSNALYDVALLAGLEVVERHPHSRAVPGSAAAAGRDATVAWNYVDLRVRPDEAVLLEAFLTRDELVLRVRGREASCAAGFVQHAAVAPDRRAAAHSCATCGVEACHHHRSGGTAPPDGRVAYVVDEPWPEFQAYLAAKRTERDVLGIPLDGTRWRRPRYAWETGGYGRVVTATWRTVARSVISRRLGRYGAARLAAQWSSADSIAAVLGRAVPPDVRRLCVSQSFLLPLWEAGILAGWAFDVLMTRPPLTHIHAALDSAAVRWPERVTLREYRAPAALVEREAEALAAAERIITPHAGIAALFGGRSILLPWREPPVAPVTRKPGRPAIAFPGPTAARKGAHEVLAAARALGLEVVLLGSDLEGEGFWEGVAVRRQEAGWLSTVDAVVQPALLEDRPRMLLAALASEVPVVATDACGLGARAGLTTVPHGDPHALAAALSHLLARR